MKILKLLVIEDDALLREALCGASREALRGVKREAIVFEASDRSEATQIVKQYGHVDLIVLDLELPDTDAFEFLRELEALLFPDNLGTSSPFLPPDLTLSWYPTVSLVVVSERQGYDIFENGGSLENDARLKEVAQIMGEDYESGQILTPRGVLRRALDEGAVGFIPKSASRETMLDAFRSIFAGGHYIPWPPPPLDPCDGPVNPRPLRTPGTAQAVDAVNREAVVADSQRRIPRQS
jgi:CheY-like chemotaxis protein